MTSYSNPNKNSTSYTNPKRSDRVAGAKFDSAIFDESKFDTPENTYTSYSNPTKNITSYSNPSAN